MLDWFQTHTAFLYSIGAISLVMIVIFPVAVMWIMIHIPADYFAQPHRHHTAATPRPLTLLRMLILILKNALGAVFFLSGIAMLVLPGQGLLAMLLGISLMNFPGKYHFERWLVTRGPTLRITNRLRQAYNRKPLVLSRK